MLIECLVKRVGPTQITIDKTPYTFMPNPFIVGDDGMPKQAKKDEPTTSVCEVVKDEHLELMLQRYPNTYRLYEASQPTPVAATVIDMSGFSITKFSEGGREGYIVEDKKKKMFAGQDGTWKPVKNGIFPWLTEFEAWTWLRSEMEFLRADEKVELTCEVCGKECGSLAGLTAHRKTHKEPV